MQLISIIIFICSYTLVIGQNSRTIPEKWKKYQYDHKVTLTKVDFYVNDTIIPYTLVQEPDGPFEFVLGHQFTNDSIALKYQFVYHTTSLQKGDTAFPNVVFETKNETLKLNDYVSEFSIKNGGILNTYNSGFQFLPFINELYYSYIFNQIGIPKISELKNDSLIRLTNYKVSPVWDENPQITIYELTRTFNQLKRKNYSIDSIHNFILDEEVIIPLKKTETKYLKTTFKSSTQEDLKYSTKTNQYNPFLIESKVGNDIKTIERSEGRDHDERNGNFHEYHSEFQSFVHLVNNFGSISPKKIEKRNLKLKNK